MYLVTFEDHEGMWLDDPSGFDTLGEARDWARRPHRHATRVIYRCDQIEEFSLQEQRDA